MIAPALLFGLAWALTQAGPVLAGARWPTRAPRLGILAWQALCLAWVASIMLAGGALALPTVPSGWTDNLGAVLGGCAEALREHYTTPAGTAAGLTGLLIALAITGQITMAMTRHGWMLRRTRRRQGFALELVARPDDDTGVWVLDDQRPAAYALPGRRSVVVVTTGALARLAPAELAAVLAHEHAHLRGRHHLVLGAASASCRAFPPVGLFRLALCEIGSLVEMAADDVALRCGTRAHLASALVRLSVSPVPRPALGATGGSVSARVTRLVETGGPLGGRRVAAVGLGILVVLALPVTIAAGPALEVALTDYCATLAHRS